MSIHEPHARTMPSVPPGSVPFRPELPDELSALQLRLDERQRHGGAVDGTVEERHHVRHAANVVLVAMCEHEGLDVGAASFDVGQIGDDQVDAKLIRIGEHDTCVNEDGGILPGERHHVHPELAKASQRDDLQRRRRHVRYRGLVHSKPSEALSTNYVSGPWQVTFDTLRPARRSASDSGSWDHPQLWKDQRLRAKAIAQLG